MKESSSRLTFYHAAAIQVSCSQPIQSSWRWCGHSWVFGTWTRHCSAQKPGKRAQLELGTASEVYVVAWNAVHIVSRWCVEEDRAARSIRTGRRWWENRRKDIVMSAVPMWLHYCFRHVSGLYYGTQRYSPTAATKNKTQGHCPVINKVKDHNNPQAEKVNNPGASLPSCMIRASTWFRTLFIHCNS